MRLDNCSRGLRWSDEPMSSQASKVVLGVFLFMCSDRLSDILLCITYILDRVYLCTVSIALSLMLSSSANVADNISVLGHYMQKG